MNEQTYQYFLEVAKRGSISKASEYLFVSQPAISKQISNLEKELGFSLFNRDPHGLSLTPGGHLFLREYEKLQTQYEKILVDAQRANAGKSGFVRIGLQEGHDVDDLLINLIHDFKSAYPNIEVDVVVLNHRTLLENLTLNKLDVGIAISFNDKNEFSNLEGRFLRTRRSYIILNARHRLAQTDTLNLEDLNQETLLVTCPDVATDGVDYVKKTCNMLNIHPRGIRLAPSYSTLYIWLAMNDGFALSDRNVWYEKSTLKFFALPPEASSTQVVYWAKGAVTSSTKLFLDYLDHNIATKAAD